jgi:hypothetical protein
MYRQYESGLFILASNGNKYTLEQWKTAVQAGTVINDDAKLILIFTGVLEEAGGVFAIDIDMVRERSVGTYNWVTSRMRFNSIPLDGNSISADYYYDGYTASIKIQQEGDARGVGTPAFDQALSQSRTIIAVDTQETITLPGFIGSVGQWKELWLNVTEVDNILLSVRPNGTYLLSTFITRKCTSTRRTEQDSWFSTTQAGSNINGDQNNVFTVLPFFACQIQN